MKPLLSIVIANFNYGRFLAEAIESVLSQGMGATVELIICDGGSTDHSLEIIKKYSEKITWWCSEPDGGQSAAFNKGFSHAKGRFLTWLNADDVLLPGVLKAFEAATLKHPDCEWFVGGVLWLDPDMNIVRCGRARPFSTLRYKEGNVCVWGPSSFFTKRILDSVGGVDERFKYGMDSDLWLRFAHLVGERYRPFVNYAWGLRLHPAAKMSGHNFTKEGKLDLNRTQSEMIGRGEKYEALENERRMMGEYFQAKRATLLTRLISASWMQVALARVDTFLWRGKHYLEYFRNESAK